MFRSALTQVSRRQLEISPDVQDMTAAVRQPLVDKLTDLRVQVALSGWC